MVIYNILHYLYIPRGRADVVGRFVAFGCRPRATMLFFRGAAAAAAAAAALSFVSQEAAAPPPCLAAVVLVIPLVPSLASCMLATHPTWHTPPALLS